MMASIVEDVRVQEWEIATIKGICKVDDGCGYPKEDSYTGESIDLCPPRDQYR